MIWDPAWIAAVLSGIAAVLAALALLKSGRSDPALVAEMGTLSERLTAGVNLLRDLLTGRRGSCAPIPGRDRRAD